MTIERARVAADCLEIAGRAAALCRAGFGRRPDAKQKGRNELVTEYDLASQALAISLVQERYPTARIIAEEGSPEGGDGGSGAIVFAIDPIDGTTNFAHGHPFWCVSIGALRATEHGFAPMAGAVVAPALDLAWHGWAGVGHGAERGALFRNGEPRTVSDTADLASALLATGFPPNRERAPENNFDSFIAVKRRAQAVRRCGSAAIDLCFVADGTYDGYWERVIQLWDSAAGAALLLGAGGKLTAMDGGPPVLERGHLVATNGRIHDELLRALVVDGGEKT